MDCVGRQAVEPYLLALWGRQVSGKHGLSLNHPKGFITSAGQGLQLGWWALGMKGGLLGCDAASHALDAVKAGF